MDSVKVTALANSAPTASMPRVTRMRPCTPQLPRQAACAACQRSAALAARASRAARRPVKCFQDGGALLAARAPPQRGRAPARTVFRASGRLGALSPGCLRPGGCGGKRYGANRPRQLAPRPATESGFRAAGATMTPVKVPRSLAEVDNGQVRASAVSLRVARTVLLAAGPVAGAAQLIRGTRAPQVLGFGADLSADHPVCPCYRGRARPRLRAALSRLLAAARSRADGSAGGAGASGHGVQAAARGHSQPGAAAPSVRASLPPASRRRPCMLRQRCAE